MKKLTKAEVRDILVWNGYAVPALKCIAFDVNTKFGGEFTLYPYQFKDVMEINAELVLRFRFFPVAGKWVIKDITFDEYAN